MFRIKRSLWLRTPIVWTSPIFWSPPVMFQHGWRMASQISTIATLHNILLFRQTSLICFQNLTVQMLVQITCVVKQVPSFSFDCVSGHQVLSADQKQQVWWHPWPCNNMRVAFTSFKSGWLKRSSLEVASRLKSRQATHCQRKWSKNCFPRPNICSHSTL